MSKKRENTNESSFGISPVASQGQLTQAVHDISHHEHVFQFAKEYTDMNNGAVYSKFVCLFCGIVRRLRQFEDKD